MQNVELDDYDSFGDDENQVTAEDIRRRAEAKIRGVSEEFIAFEEVGIMIIDENEEDELT